MLANVHFQNNMLILVFLEYYLFEIFWHGKVPFHENVSCFAKQRCFLSGDFSVGLEEGTCLELLISVKTSKKILIVEAGVVTSLRYDTFLAVF